MIRQMYNDGKSITAIASHYGITRARVRQILNRDTLKNTTTQNLIFGKAQKGAQT